MVVFGQKWLYSGTVAVFGHSGSIRPKLVEIGQIWLNSDKVVVFSQKWFYSGKMFVLGQKLLYSCKMDVFGQSG